MLRFWPVRFCHKVTLGFSALSVIFVIILFYIHNTPAPEAVGTTVEAQQASELKYMATEDLPIGNIKVFDLKAKEKLKLPASVVSNPKKKVVASSKVKASERPRTISTVVDTDTGEFTTYSRTDPLPWLAVNTRTHVGAYYGWKDGTDIVRIQARQEFLQVKQVHLEAIASVDIGGLKTDSFIGIGGRLSF